MITPVVGLTLVVPWPAGPTIVTLVGSSVPSGSLSLDNTLITTAVFLFVVAVSLPASGGALTVIDAVAVIAPIPWCVPAPSSATVIVVTYSPVTA